MIRPVHIIRIGWLAIALWSATGVSGQSRDEKSVRNHPYVKSSKCETCHRNPIKDSEDFLGQSSAQGWSDVKHDHAFQLLYQGRNPADPQQAAEKQKLVTRILGFEFASAFDDTKGPYEALSPKPELRDKVAKVKQCLNCHATDTRANENHDPLIAFDLGVSCQACHGPGQDWEDPHQVPWWRKVTPSAKRSLGFENVRNPAVRAGICASCHVGNLEEGKFVTHEWYANGHPPLPSFEYSTFAAAMPPHWQSLREKRPDFRGRDAQSKPPSSREYPNEMNFRRDFKLGETDLAADYHRANFPAQEWGDHDRYRDLPRLRDNLIAGAVVLDTYAKLLEDYSRIVQGKPTNGGTPYPVKLAWPEFALHDCASCHHELRSGAGSPSRLFGRGTVGRPPASLWPAALARIGVQAVEQDQNLAARDLQRLADAQQQLELAITHQVFGVPAELERPANRLRTEVAAVIARLKKSEFQQSTAERTLVLLVNPRNIEFRDYHSARQAAWSIREIKRDLHDVPYQPARDDPRQATQAKIEQLFQAPRPPGQSFADVLFLALPAQQSQSILENNVRMLPGAAAYDPAELQRHLGALRANPRWLPGDALPADLLPPVRPGP